MDRPISFRWGIPWLDFVYTTIPNFFFRRYVEVGITRDEFLFVLHLASYKFESPRGQARPSIPTIAVEMGCSKRHVQRLRAALVEKALLIVTERPGRPSQYSFENLAIRLLQLELADGSEDAELVYHPEEGGVAGRAGGDSPVTHDTGVMGTHDSAVMGPMTPLSPEEQQENKNIRTTTPAVAAFSENDKREGIGLLLGCGITRDAAAALVDEYSLERIREVVAGLGGQGGVRNRAGWVVSALRGRYDVSAAVREGRGEELLERQMQRCAFYRNDSLGDCDSIVAGRALMPWCGRCGKLAIARVPLGV